MSLTRLALVLIAAFLAVPLVVTAQTPITATHLGVNDSRLSFSFDTPKFPIPANNLTLIWIATDHYDLTGDPVSLTDSSRTWTKIGSRNLTKKGVTLWKSIAPVDTNAPVTITHAGGTQGTRSNWVANYYTATSVAQAATGSSIRPNEDMTGTVTLPAQGSGGAVAAAFIRASTDVPPTVATAGPGYTLIGGEVFGVEIVTRSEFSPQFQQTATMSWDKNSIWIGIAAEIVSNTLPDTTPPTTSIVSVEGDVIAPYVDSTIDGASKIVVSGESGMSCRWYDSDFAYSDASGSACSVTGAQATCSVPSIAGTSLNKYVACKDSAGNGQSASGNLDVSWTVSASPPPGAYQAELLSLTGGTILDIEIDPQNPNVVYAAALHDSVWKSTNKGDTWALFSTKGLPQNVEVDPFNSNIIYLTTRSATFKTTNGGNTWTQLTGVGGSYGIVINPTNSQNLYVGGDGIVSSSNDGGSTWTTVTLSGMGNTDSMDIDPANPSIVFLGDNKACLWRSKNSAASWEKLGCATGQYMSVKVSPSNTKRVYSTLGVSDDGGDTWTDIPSPTKAALAVHPTNPDVAFFAGNMAGAHPVYATNNGGKSAYETKGMSPNYDATEIRGLAIDAVNDILYVGGDSLYKGTGALTGKVAVYDSSKGIYANAFTDMKATQWAVWVSGDSMGVHKTEDQGATWRRSVLGMHGLDSTRDITPDPTNPNVAFAGHEGHIHKTTDGGKSWATVFTGLFPHMTVDYGNSQIVYAGMSDNKLYKSVDGGITWNILSQAGRDVFIHPTNPSIVYTSNGGSLYRSDDKGSVWNSVGTLPGGQLFITKSNPSTMYSTKDLDGVYKSTNGGASWTKLSYSGVGPKSMAQTTDGSLWVADHRTCGLYRSTDEGATWTNKVGGTCFMRVVTDPWDAESLFALSSSGNSTAWWVHPTGKTRMPASPPPPEPTQATIQISSCQILDRSNTIYEVTKNLDPVGTGSCFLFPRNVHDITIDGKGYTVNHGSPAIFGDSLEDIVIKNMIINMVADGFGKDSIHLGNVKNLKILNTDIRIPGGSLTYARSEDAISVSGIFSENVEISDNKIDSTSFFSSAVYVNGPPTTVIKNNKITAATGSKGIQIAMSPNSMIENNVISSDLEAVDAAFSNNLKVSSNTGSGGAAKLLLKNVNDSLVQDNELKPTRGVASGRDTITLSDSHKNLIKNTTLNIGARSSYGLRLFQSSENRIEGMKIVDGIYPANSNEGGVMIDNSHKNNFTGLNISVGTDAASTGINFASSTKNKVADSAIQSTGTAIILTSSATNMIYNNIIQGATFVNAALGFQNSWSITKQAGLSIVNGPFQGGNFYAKGISESCADSNSDSICDTTLVFNANNIDQLPLKKGTGTPAPPTPPSISSVAAAATDTTGTVSWNTDLAADSSVTYADNAAMTASLTVSDTALVTSHQLVLFSLAPEKTYYYKVTSCAAGLCSSSATLNFMTTPPPVLNAADVNLDGKVNLADMLEVLADFRKPAAQLSNPRSDINSDGTTNIKDVGILLSVWTG